jgi:hypothetical protein
MAEPPIGLWRVAARVYEHHKLRQRVHLVPSSQRIGLRGKSQQEMPGFGGSALTAPLRNTGLRGKRCRASGEVDCRFGRKCPPRGRVFAVVPRITTAGGGAGLRKEQVGPGDSDTGLRGSPGCLACRLLVFRRHPLALEDRGVLARPRKRAGKLPEASPSRRAPLAGAPTVCN